MFIVETRCRFKKRKGRFFKTTFLTIIFLNEELSFRFSFHFIFVLKKVLRRIPKCSMASLEKWQFQFKKSKTNLCKHLKPFFQQNMLTNDLLSNLLESFLKLVQYVALLFNLKKCHICELIFNLRVSIGQ